MQNKLKKCTRCGVIKPVTQFHKCARNPDGLRYRCKACANKADREYYASSSERQFSRFAIWIKRKHGITGEQYRAMLKLQGGVCAICGKVESAIHQGEPRRLAIDHCHQQKMVRGLLCVKCNIGIGQFCNDPKLLRKAALYLEKPIILPEQALKNKGGGRTDKGVDTESD